MSEFQPPGDSEVEAGKLKQLFFEQITNGAPELADQYRDLVTSDVQQSLDRMKRSVDMFVPLRGTAEYLPPESFRGKPELDLLLSYASSIGVNDIKFGDAEPITVRVEGKIYRLTHRLLTTDELRSIMVALYDSTSIVTSVLGGERADFAYTCRSGGKQASRWRVCVTLQGGYDGIGFRVVCRKISISPPTVAEVYLQPDIVNAVMNLDRGIFLVTGPTGSGKSTSLAALLRHRMQSIDHSDHLITIESPIEYLHKVYPSPYSEVTQWEVPRMLHSFGYAVETALRSDPDLVLIGEMRDRATMKAGLEVSLTGHGCFSTMHTNSVVQTVTRFLQTFDKEEVGAVQYDLVDNLHMIVSQLLRAGPDGRRVALRERLEFDGQIKERLRSTKNLTKELRKVMESYGRLMVEEARDLFKEGRLAEEQLKRIEWMDSKERSALDV
jgi:Tfp pilus assembly pilus retraction ATPase PilT